MTQDMNCERFASLLDQFQQGNLEQDLEETAKEHLAACSRCRLLSALWEDSHRMHEEDEVPVSFRSSWQTAILDEEEETMQEIKTKTPKKIGKHLNRWLALAATLVLVVGGTYLAGQSRRQGPGGRSTSLMGSNTTYEAYDAGYGAPTTSRAAAQFEGAMDAQVEASASMKASEAPADLPAKIIRTLNLDLSTRDFEADRQRIEAAMKAAGAWSQSTNLGSQYGSDLRVLRMTLRVPSSQLDSLTNALRGVGRLVSYQENAEDVSERYADTQTRLRTQRSKMERLQALLAQALTMQDLITIESGIQETQYEIDRLEGSLKGLDNKVDYATLYLNLTELGPLQTSQDQAESLWQRVKSAVTAAFEGFLLLLSDLLVFLVVALPYVFALVILVLIIRHLIKRRKKS